MTVFHSLINRSIARFEVDVEADEVFCLSECFGRVEMDITLEMWCACSWSNLFAVGDVSHAGVGAEVSQRSDVSLLVVVGCEAPSSGANS